MLYTCIAYDKIAIENWKFQLELNLNPRVGGAGLKAGEVQL